MIRVTVEIDSAGKGQSLEISGHGGRGPKGSDILCAAVSTLGQTYVFSAARIEDVEQRVKQQEGYLFSEIDTQNTSGESRACLKDYLDFVIYGIIELEKHYPGDIELSVRHQERADKGEKHGT